MPLSVVSIQICFSALGREIFSSDLDVFSVSAVWSVREVFTSQIWVIYNSDVFVVALYPPWSEVVARGVLLQQ